MQERQLERQDAVNALLGLMGVAPKEVTSLSMSVETTDVVGEVIPEGVITFTVHYLDFGPEKL
jgi:hypothetical protein